MAQTIRGRAALALLLGSALALGAVGCGGSSSGPSGPTSPIGAQTVTITAADFKFSPNTITATAGSQLTVVLQNQGPSAHSIDFQLPGGDVALPGTVSPGASGTLNLTVPTQTGNYTFFCPVAGHRDLGMTGTLTVTAAAPTAADGGTTPKPDTGPAPMPTPTPTPTPTPGY